MAGIPALGSIFNVVITISVISVANSATYASTRTLQALAMQGMAPKLLAYVDKAGRPVPTIILQLLFGLLAFINVSFLCFELLFLHHFHAPWFTSAYQTPNTAQTESLI